MSEFFSRLMAARLERSCLSEATRKVVSYVTSPAKMVNMMESSGFFFDRDGSVWFFKYDLDAKRYTKDKVKAGRDIVSAIRGSDRILDGLKSKIKNHKRLSSNVSKTMEHARQAASSDIDAEIVEEDFMNGIEPFMGGERVKDPRRIELNKMIRKIGDRIIDADYDSVAKICDKTKSVVDQLVDKWSSQMKAFQARRDMLESAEIMHRRRPELFQQILGLR